MHDALVTSPTPVHEAFALAAPQDIWSQVSVRQLTLDEVDPIFLAEWRNLEVNSQTGHPFLSADFILPATRRLWTTSRPVLLAVERQNSLIGLGVFEVCPGSRRLPVTHLRAWQTPHTYADGLLLRQGAELDAAYQLLNWLQASGAWHGVEFPRLRIDSLGAQALARAAQLCGIQSIDGDVWRRAALCLNQHDAGNWLNGISLQRARSLRRGRNWLERYGDVEFEFVTDPDRFADCADELLALEAMGWKFVEGTALAAQGELLSFFKDVVDRLGQRNQVFFSRLTLNGQAIASVVHLISGSTAFAFKLGWNPTYERGCPGFQIKALAAARAAETFPQLTWLDSCAAPGSFIEHIWPQRVEFCNRLYPLTPLGNASARATQRLRRIKRRTQAVASRLLSDESTSPPGGSPEGGA